MSVSTVSALIVSNHPDDVVKKPSSTLEHEKITIRLSDLGIIQRTPSQTHLQIQGVRIGYILDNTIDKLQMAVCLPRLLRNDACLLHPLMRSHEIEFILGICSKYLKLPTHLVHLHKSSFGAILDPIDRISLNDSKKKLDSRYGMMTEEENYVDPQMAHVMQILWKNQKLREKVLTEFPLITENPSTELVRCVRTLKQVAESKFATSATEERTREKQLRRAWKTNFRIEQQILETREMYEKQREQLVNLLENKNATITDSQTKIETLKHQFKEEARHLTMKSEKAMAEECNVGEQHQEELSAEAKAITLQYETLLMQHMATEKGLRARRFKVETQLCSWLAKYDADIGERQAEFDELTKGYEAEKAIMEGIQEQMDDQDDEYQELLAQLEEEEQLWWEEKAYEYLLNRSARKIQRTWRAYRQRKIDRKNAKKARAKAKKLAKEAKAARKAAIAAGALPGEGGAAPKAGGKGKKGDKGKGKGKGKKGKKEKAPPTEGRGPDFQAALESKFGDELLGDLKGEEFSKKEVVVDLSEGL